MNTPPYSVTELTINIKRILEKSFSRICVQGEISNLALPRSGHAYFNIKDANAQIPGVMFRSRLMSNKFRLEDGQELIFQGSITVYEPRGAYQLIIDRVEPVGAGALQLAFDQLKKKLKNEGLFDDSHKKELPPIPKGIGIVTSPTGAAIRDMLNILGRRFPQVPVQIYPALVQGEQAADEIAAGIAYFQDQEEIDLLIVGRGGGSLEDLWAFNEEKTARAIFASKIPVISAVGHEVDFTIADFTADLRAPTPSAAAELAVPDRFELLRQADMMHVRLLQAIDRYIKNMKEKIDHCEKRLTTPRWVIQKQMIRTDELTTRLTHAIERKLLRIGNRVELLERRTRAFDPAGRIAAYKLRVDDLKKRLQYRVSSTVDQKKYRLQELTRVLDSVSPLAVLDRGYASVADKENHYIQSVQDLQVGSEIQVGMKDGTVDGVVKKIHKKRRSKSK